MLVVIGAMMALSIDVVTFYTARSEAQLAADASALAAARVLRQLRSDLEFHCKFSGSSGHARGQRGGARQ